MTLGDDLRAAASRELARLNMTDTDSNRRALVRVILDAPDRSALSEDGKIMWDIMLGGRK
jgi:hypothetical protein